MNITTHLYSKIILISLCICLRMELIAQALPFTETFEDDDFTSRGWYDSPQGTLTTAEHIDGSTSCFECKFLLGASTCDGGTPGRHLFDETDEVYLSYYVKYSVNYTGSNRPYHPHEFHFLTNENDIYVGPAYTHLTTYIEQNEGIPLLAIQDGENISEDDIGIDLTAITEDRAISGCNGDSDGYGDGECYVCGAVHCNGKKWNADTIYFQDGAWAYYKNDWHFVEAYFKLNSIDAGVGQADGVVQYWYDGELLIDHHDVMIRTGNFPDMKFNQFLIAPYIGDGSPVEQFMWVDDLTIATARPAGTEIHQQLNQTRAEIFPNPFETTATFTFTSNDVSQKNLVISNVIGENIKSVSIPNGLQSVKIGRDGLSDGIYFYRLQHAGFTIASGSFIVE